MAIQLENKLKQEDRDCMWWLYSHDLINFDAIDQILERELWKPDEPEEFEAKKTYKIWVQTAIETLTHDLVKLDNFTSKDMEQRLDTLKFALLFGQSYRKNTSFTTNVDFEGHFMTNPFLLYTVLCNLVKNARKQRPRSFEINLSISEYKDELPEVTYPPIVTLTEPVMKITVSDNCRGFDMQDFSLLFNRPESRISGGFGLYYSAKVCDVLGCHIAINSTKKGSDVSLYHPMY